MRKAEILLYLEAQKQLIKIRPRSDEKVYEMLEAQTNCTFLSLVSLVNYGNWCGPGSNGKDPVDDVDTCCQVLTQHPMLDFFQ